MNRHSWQDMRPWRRRAEHGRPFDEGRFRRGEAPSEQQADASSGHDEEAYYGYESFERPHYAESKNTQYPYDAQYPYEKDTRSHSNYVPPTSYTSRGNYAPQPRYASQSDYTHRSDHPHQAGYDRQADYEHDREQQWHRPLYSDLSDQDNEGYQYFGGGRQNYAGVESGSGSLAIHHYLPQASSAAFYDWDRSLWGGREATGVSSTDYSGRGPRDYERSDERIREDICECLSDDPFVDPSDVTVNVQAGVVTLEGTVEDRPQKYRIEDLADDCRGVKEMQSRITVSQRPSEAELGDWASDKTPKH